MIITNVDLLANSSNHEAMFPEYSRNIPRMSVSKIFHGYPQNILVKLFLLTRLREVFNTFQRRTAKAVVYRGIWLVHTSEKFMVGVQNLQEK